MDNHFLKNNGPFRLRDILKDLNLKNIDKSLDHDIIDIKDLQNSKSNEITFFHSKNIKRLQIKQKLLFV